MRAALIAIVRNSPADWSDNQKQGWSEIHHIVTPELKHTDGCFEAEQIAYELKNVIENIWYEMEEDMIIRLFIQCDPCIFNFISKWYAKQHFVYPIFAPKFIGWRVYELPDWARPIYVDYNWKSKMPDTMLIGGLTRERQGVKGRGVNPHQSTK